jgi:hypothetical protein
MISLVAMDKYHGKNINSGCGKIHTWKKYCSLSCNIEIFLATETKSDVLVTRKLPVDLVQ